MIPNSVPSRFLMNFQSIAISASVLMYLVFGVGVGTIASRAQSSGDVVPLTDQNVIGIPQGDEVTILLDLFPFEMKLKGLNLSDRNQLE